jgi:hypothetical protein
MKKNLLNKLLMILGISLISTSSLTACSTPSVMLKNPSTGQVVKCGGDASGSMMGGLIGYNIQKNNDDKCIADYESQGFKKIQ